MGFFVSSIQQQQDVIALRLLQKVLMSLITKWSTADVTQYCDRLQTLSQFPFPEASLNSKFQNLRMYVHATVANPHTVGLDNMEGSTCVLDRPFLSTFDW